MNSPMSKKKLLDFGLFTKLAMDSRSFGQPFHVILVDNDPEEAMDLLKDERLRFILGGNIVTDFHPVQHSTLARMEELCYIKRLTEPYPLGAIVRYMYQCETGQLERIWISSLKELQEYVGPNPSTAPIDNFCSKLVEVKRTFLTLVEEGRKTQLPLLIESSSQYKPKQPSIIGLELFFHRKIVGNAVHAVDKRAVELIFKSLNIIVADHCENDTMLYWVWFNSRIRKVIAITAGKHNYDELVFESYQMCTDLMKMQFEPVSFHGLPPRIRATQAIHPTSMLSDQMENMSLNIYCAPEQLMESDEETSSPVENGIHFFHVKVVMGDVVRMECEYNNKFTTEDVIRTIAKMSGVPILFEVTLERLSAKLPMPKRYTILARTHERPYTIAHMGEAQLLKDFGFMEEETLVVAAW